MNIKLREFKKLFFLFFFIIFFYRESYCQSPPDLPNKISPILEKVYSLPRKPQAELNIEVTKINSQPLNNVFINKKDSKLYIDFSKIESLEELTKKYTLILTDSKNRTNLIKYKVVNYNGGKVLEIQYTDQMEKLYATIKEKNSENILKVYNIDINLAKNIHNTEGDFEINYNMEEIVIIPALDGSNDKAIFEYPNNFIEMKQLNINENIFPVIGINNILGLNNSSFNIHTDKPLNPIGERPYIILDLNGKIVKVPITLKETPNQTPQKFFIYTRGDMTNRNTAVGAYTPLNSNNPQIHNHVKVDFQVKLEELAKEDLKTILNYAKERFKENPNLTSVPLPFKNFNNTYHKILPVKGLQNNSSNIFNISSENIIREKIINFPKISVLRDPDINTAILNFKNPVPKSNTHISGTYDILNGDLKPNYIGTFIHDDTLQVSGLKDNWKGFKEIPEYHKVKIYSGDKIIQSKLIGEFVTTPKGEIRDIQTIKMGENEFIFTKGVKTPLAIGVKTWNFDKVNSTISLVHLNKYDSEIAQDIYKISIDEFDPKIYLNKDPNTSTLINSLSGTNKDHLTVKNINPRQDFIELGTLKLNNYQKDITETKSDPLGLHIDVLSSEITLKSENSQLKGYLSFKEGKPNIQNPDEIGTLIFTINNNIKIEDIAGKTFKYNDESILTKIVGGGKVSPILKTLTLEINEEDSESGDLIYMSFVSTISDTYIREKDFFNINNSLNIPGKMTLHQLRNGKDNSVPAIALGKYEDWKTIGYDLRRNNPRKRENLNITYSVAESSLVKEIPMFPKLIQSRASSDESGIDVKLYKEKDKNNKTILALCYAVERDTQKERITTHLAYNITEKLKKTIIELLKTVPGDNLTLIPKSENSKIAYIHARDTKYEQVDDSENNPMTIPASNIHPHAEGESHSYQSLPKIIIHKEKELKNMSIYFKNNYTLKEAIVFKNDNLLLPSTGIEINGDEKSFTALDYKHSIELTFPNGETKNYSMGEDGKLSISEYIYLNNNHINLNIEYISHDNVKISLNDREGTQDFYLTLKHKDPSGFERKTINLHIKSDGSEIPDTIVKGELDLIISSRYNATEVEGQLLSKPLAITSTGITYESEVLELNLLQGDLLEAPGEKEVFINDQLISTLKNSKITLDNGTILKIIKNNGDLIIKPLKWSYNTSDELKLTYKINDTITHEYILNIKCPEFFVASVGELDFGKVFKFGNPQDKTVTTNIELTYIDGSISPYYTLDTHEQNLDGGDLSHFLYLNDEKTLLVKNLHLGEEKGKNSKHKVIPLTGTLDGKSINNSNIGTYGKTIEILIYLK